MSDEKQTDHSFFAGLFLGGLVGAALIVILGTEKGKKIAQKLTDEGLDFLDEAKETIGEKTEEVKKQVVLQVEELQEKGSNLIDEGKKAVEAGKVVETELIQKAVETKNNIADEAIATADAALAHIEEIQERGRRSTAELRKKLFKNIPKRTS